MGLRMHGVKKMENKRGRKNKFVNKSESLFLGEINAKYLTSIDSEKIDPSKIRQLPLTLIVPGKYQPRRDFDDSELVSLAESVMTHGVMQPIIVRPIKNSQNYEIIAGERRWRASKIAHLTSIPAIVRDDISDKSALALGLIENIQRENLNAIEEAIAFERLINEFMMTHKKVSETIGKSRVAITNSLRLLKLPKIIQGAVASGTIQAGHAKVLLSLPEAQIIDVFHYLVRATLSVRELEKYVRGRSGGRECGKKEVIFRRVSRDESRLEDLMLELFNRKCSVKLGKNGFVQIPFNSGGAGDIIDMLEEILEQSKSHGKAL